MQLTSLLIYLMNLFLQQNQLHVSSILQSIFLSELRFQKRFIKTSRLEDPYRRVYDISHDAEDNNKRMAIKDYSASTKSQRDDVLMNLQSYKCLEQTQGISKLVAFCHVESTGDIMAAFEYNDSTLDELIDMHFFQDNRSQFYLFVLKELLYVHKIFKRYGIELEDLIPSNILLYKVQNYFRIKILYDQREKKYDTILEGIKVYCSAENIEAMLTCENKEQSQQNAEFIFQLGLLLLDLIYVYELNCNKRGSLKEIGKNFELNYKGYHIFHDASSVRLNMYLINQKKYFLQALNDNFIDAILQLIDRMIAPQQQRISFQDLTISQKMLSNIENPIVIDIDCITPNRQISPIKQKKSPNDSLKYSEQHSAHQIQPHHKNVGTQTTITKNVFMDSGPQIDSKNSNFSQLSINYNLIPKNKILGQINAHSSVRDQLSKFISILECKSTVIKKEYLDNTVYYGQIDPINHKRHGLGMYIHGDLYFGNWKENILIDGIYIFKNGDCYEGVVRNGKQGWGRYYYSNGNIYQGDWKDDLKSGRGKMTYSNGDAYDGMWMNGKKNGQGTYYYQNGAIFKGNFVHGKKQGFGFIVFPNQTRVEAYWIANNIEGHGKIFYANGHYYEGDFYSSQKQGVGTYKWEDQTRYQGQFKKDHMLGEASIKFFENEFYEGQIKDGKRQGYGVYRYTNGDQFKGQWKNDEKVKGQYKFHDGRSFEGRFKKNEMSYGVLIYENGDSYEGQFSNGQRHGIGFYRNSAGQIIYDGKWAKDKFSPNL